MYKRQTSGRTGRSRSATSTATTAYIVYGRTASTPVNLADVAAGRGGFGITVPRGPLSGIANGDFDGDGRRDLLLGVQFDDAGGRDSGGAYVVFRGSGRPATVDLDAMAAG